MLLRLIGLLRVNAAAAAEMAAAVRVGCLLGCLFAPWLVAVGSCILLLNRSGLLIAIASAAVKAPAALRVALRLQLPLRSSARHGGQLHPAAQAQRRAQRHHRRRCRCSGRSCVSCCLFSRLHAPWRVTVGSCTVLLALSGVLLAPSPSPLSRRRPPCVSRCFFSYLYAPRLVTVGSCIVLLVCCSPSVACSSRHRRRC